MGNSLGHIPTNTFNRIVHPEVTPEPFTKPSFDPQLGFEGRKARVMVALPEELVSAKIPLENRDYCAHFLLNFRACRKENFPFVIKCAHEKHEYLHCQYEDFVLRMKEYERERRLLVRQQKQLRKAQKESM